MTWLHDMEYDMSIFAPRHYGWLAEFIATKIPYTANRTLVATALSEALHQENPHFDPIRFKNVIDIFAEGTKLPNARPPKYASAPNRLRNLT